MNTIQGSIMILYVKNHGRSKAFYQCVLDREPTLDVDGMTEYELDGSTKLGLMPEDGIVRILEGKVLHPAMAGTAPRAEVYLYVDQPEKFYNRLVQAGGTAVSDAALRSWGDIAAYGLDPDGHVIAFASHA